MEEVSEENERACMESVGKIGEFLIKRAESGTEAVKEAMRTESEGGYRSVMVAVKLLWLEEQTVAKAMLVT